jgi:hypothetical protein
MTVMPKDNGLFPERPSLGLQVQGDLRTALAQMLNALL